MNLSTINNILFEKYSNRQYNYLEKGYRYYHGQRVANLSGMLRKIVMPDDATYDDIITIAAWCHDIMNVDGNRSISDEDSMTRK